MGGAALHLLRHDLRLNARDMLSGLRRLGKTGLLMLLAIVALVMHGAAAIGYGRIVAARSGGDEALLHGGALFILMLLVAQSLNGMTRALYGRGDLDLLVSSPLPPRVVLPVRALAVAATAFGSAAIFILPVADVALLRGQVSWLALLPTLGAAALLATAVATGLVLTLFALIGPRRARFVAQVIATAMGGGFMLLLQLNRLLPAGPATRQWLGTAAAALDWPLRAEFGDALALTAWIAATLLGFGAMTLSAGPLFLRQAVKAASQEGAVPLPRSGRRFGRDRAFRTGPAAVLRAKERRIVLRDPWIVSQILLQLLYVLPLFAVLWSRNGATGSPAVAIGSTAVVVSFQLAASLTWLGLSGEDAPDLVGTAPIAADRVTRAKIQSILGMTALVTGPLLVWLAATAPAEAAAVVSLAIFAALAAIALNGWHGRPTRRRLFAARHRESKLLALIEMAMAMVLGIGAALIAAGSAWGLVPVGIAAAMLCANRRPAAAA